MDLVLGDSAYAFSPDPGRPEDLALAEPRAEQNGQA
jgi:hypothetical protein